MKSIGQKMKHNKNTIIKKNKDINKYKYKDFRGSRQNKKNISLKIASFFSKNHDLIFFKCIFCN